MKVPVTVKGAENLRAELQDLKTVKRPAVILAIAEARAHGDLRENAEYHAAREQQSFIEGRISELEGKLSNLQIIDVTKLQNKGKVIFGATVTLLDVVSEQKIVYQIVGDDEADIKEGKISLNSPIARAVMAKEVGDVAVVNTPAGPVEYEVDQVEYV